MWKVEVTKMTSSHRAGGLFTAMSSPDKRTVRRGFICKSIRDLKYNTVFDGGLFTAMSFPDKRTVRRGFICKSIRDLKYNTVFDGDSENISFM